jgi:uncharacterized SAM-binding protein YcdF (DUF218 family)
MKCKEGLLLLLIGSLLISSCFFLGPRPSRRLAEVGVIKPLDVAIVPGLPLQKGQWDTLLKARMLWSLYLYKNGYVKNFIYSGNAVYTKWTEGKAMTQYAIQLGIPADHVFTDTVAEHSTENFYQGCRIAAEKGFKTIALATDPFQCALLYKYARKSRKEKIWFLPVIQDSIRSYYGLHPVIDSNSCVNGCFIPIGDRQNYRQRLQGTEGKNAAK